MSTSRPAAVAGSFYPSAPKELAFVVDDLLANCHSAPVGDARAFIAPHAGFQYSGQIAAEVYAQLKNLQHEISCIVLIGPCHRVWIDNIALPSVVSFETPLGKINIDQPLANELSALRQVQISDQAHQFEHSLEVQLPFIQRVFSDLNKPISIVPLVVGGASVDEVAQLIEICLSDPRNLLIVSSDLSHFHRYQQAQIIDQNTTRLILGLDYQQVTQEMACGNLAIKALLKFAKHASLTARTLAQCNSGDTGGDRERVVGYAAYAFI